ncbi:MAG: DUF302 domain-containing protein [Acidobacteriota bacterium]
MTVVFAGVGIVLGLALAAVMVLVLTRSRMIDVFTSPHDFEETVTRLESAVADAGWLMPDSKRLNDSLEKGNVRFPHRVHLIKLCEPRHPAEVPTDKRQVACLMPCTFAVFQTDGGAVRVSRKNTALMGKVFGGSIRRVMGGGVADAERTMLRRALRPS